MINLPPNESGRVNIEFNKHFPPNDPADGFLKIEGMLSAFPINMNHFDLPVQIQDSAISLLSI